MNKRLPSLLLLPALALGQSLVLAAPARADAALGFGLTITFGPSGPQTGAGLRLFSDDEEDSTVASLGLDYMFSGGWRASLGVAHLGEEYYIGGDVGYGLTGGGFDFGLSGGWADTAPKPSTGGGGGGPA